MFMQEPRLLELEMGSVRWFEAQKQIILEKPLLKYCYDDWYRRFLSDLETVPNSPGSKILELGSGASYLNSLRNDIITSDVTSGVADRVIDARALPFPDNSLRAIFLSHVFHHIPDVMQFLNEVERVLVPGGVLSMIEVAHTPFARFFFSHFHHEPYDDRADTWDFSQSDAMKDSNQALSWMVFVRDRKKRESTFPALKLEATEFLPWVTYLLSGGVTRRAILPPRLAPAAVSLEKAICRLSRFFALHWYIRLRKISGVEI